MEINVINKVRDLFGEVYVGGSYAVDTILGNDINPKSDIDFYIKNRFITREMLKAVIEDVLFKGQRVEFTCDPLGNPGYYKMPNIRKRISVEVWPVGKSGMFGQIYKTKRYDFMFIEDLDTAYLLKNQASTATQCCLKLDFSHKGYTQHKTDYFTKAHGYKLIHLNIHDSWCTVAHKEKLHRKYENYEIVEYSTPRIK